MSTSATTDRNDPSRWQDLARVYVNDSDSSQTGVPFDAAQINDLESLLRDVRGMLTGIVNGSINVNQFDLNPLTDGVTSQSPKSNSPANFTPASVHGTALAANENRKEFYVQNLGTPGVLVKLGANPSASSYNVQLTGTYNVYRDEFYTGIVTTTGYSNSPSFIAWERV
jgi:hypothetical protein